MEIDAFTVGAQVVNFLVLVYLLKRFLYGPVIEAIERRRGEITARARRAEREQAEAREEARELRARREALEERADALLRDAERDAEERRTELLEETRRDAERARESWRETVRRERESLLAEMRERAARQVHRTARRVLADLTGADLDRRAVEVALQRLEELPQDERGSFARAADQEERVTLRSASELPEELVERIRARVEALVGRGIELEVTVRPDVVCGLELRAGDRKIGWSVESYLDELERHVGAVLGEGGRDGG